MRALHIPFTTSFRHASAERHETASVYVEATTDTGIVGYGEGCPRPYVTGETVDTALAFLATVEAAVRDEITDAATLARWVAEHSAAIDANPAAWCAIELAILHLLGVQAAVTVERLLGLPELSGAFGYTAVLGDLEPESFHGLVRRYQQLGFRDFKVKLSGDVARDRAKLRAFQTHATSGLRVRADANNVWATADEAIAALTALDFPLWAVEEPIPPNRPSELSAIADAVGTRIVLDESVLRCEQLPALPEPASRWIVNVRVSKQGGLLRALDVVRGAAARGIGIVVGAQVGETSLLTRAALTAATAAGPSLLAQEGAFGTHLLSRDVVDPPLMFDRGGLLSVSTFPWLRMPGLGLTVSSSRL